MIKFVAAFVTPVVLGSGMLCAQSAPMPSGDTSTQDRQFVMGALEGNLFEITAARLAEKKSKNQQIKDFAQEMVTDHTAMDGKLMPFAQSMNIQPTNKLKPADAQEIARLRALGGDKFNMEYVKVVDAEHHKARGDFRNERDTTANADLKMTVSEGYDKIKEHTDKIDAIATGMNLPVPADSAPNPAAGN